MRFAPRSGVPGIVWPALPDQPAAMLLALAFQLEQSQWWPPDELAHHQARQRDLLLAHAATTAPAYEGLDPHDWSRVPVMSRDQIVAAGPRLLSRGYPAAHGPVEEVASSRSTGEPVRVRGNAVVSTFWQALALRDHLWHRRDLGAHLAMIRYTNDGEAPPPDGVRRRGWNAATSIFAPDAPLSVLSITSTTDEQITWLTRERPDYLLIYPSALDAMLRRLRATGASLSPLRGVATMSEVLTAETRALCREVLGLPIVDSYSASEVGAIALQCPDHDGYHVQAERVLVEILDGDGAPCPVGASGRVVITDLHNFATPILRYDIGDFAEVGARCPCKRGLPVLTRIAGRRRNMLTYPDGRTVWPVFTITCRKAARYRAMQLVQPRADTLRARVVPDGPLDETALADALRASFGFPFAVEIELVDELRGPSGKLEEFVSLLA